MKEKKVDYNCKKLLLLLLWDKIGYNDLIAPSSLWKFELGFLFVRLNLINHFVGFIPYKFACNSALRNPVFRWKLCKGSVWESVKKCSRLCTEAGTRDWISWVAHDWQAARGCTQVKHVEKLNRHTNYSTIGQKVQIGHSVSSQFELMTQSSREAKSPASSILEKLTLCIPFTHKYKYPLYPWNVESFQREFWERNPREKQD